MADLSAFPITTRWTPAHPDRIQLYSFPTPNGIKVSAALEETGLPYDAHRISIMDNDQMAPEFIALSPNNKIPAILDPDGPDGKPIGLFESGAILVYLSEKTGLLAPTDARGKSEALQWLMFQMGGVGPMFGQLGFFHKFAGADIEDKRARDRYVNETRRLFGVMEARLDGRDHILDWGYSIADIALWPWVRTIDGFYGAGELVGTDAFPRVRDWVKRCEDRPASQKAVNIPPREV